MKNVKRIAVALVLFVAATGFVNAQSKVAHINVQQLLSDMPEMKAAQAELKKLQETYRADIQSSMTELQNKYTQYQNEATSKTREENEQRAVELQGFEKNIQEAEQAAMQEMQKKQQELFSPISEKAKAAIEKNPKIAKLLAAASYGSIAMIFLFMVLHLQAHLDRTVTIQTPLRKVM